MAKQGDIILDPENNLVIVETDRQAIAFSREQAAIFGQGMIDAAKELEKLRNEENDAKRLDEQRGE